MRVSVPSSLSIALLALAASVLPSGASHAAVSAAAPATCEFARTLCLWENESYEGARFTAQASNSSTGSCVKLAAHGWGDGRAQSARNSASLPAILYANTDCTGSSYMIVPSGSYGSIDFASQSVFVH